MTDPVEPPDRESLVSRLFLWIILLLFIVIFLGMVGFRYFFKLDWIDCFQNATHFAAGKSPTIAMETTEQKLFTSFYAIISFFIFIAIAAYFIDQIVNIEFFESLLS